LKVHDYQMEADPGPGELYPSGLLSARRRTARQTVTARSMVLPPPGGTV